MIMVFTLLYFVEYSNVCNVYILPMYTKVLFVILLSCYLMYIGLSVGSLFWSSLVNWVNSVGHALGFSPFVSIV